MAHWKKCSSIKDKKVCARRKSCAIGKRGKCRNSKRKFSKKPKRWAHRGVSKRSKRRKSKKSKKRGKSKRRFSRRRSDALDRALEALEQSYRRMDHKLERY